ncbi:hypothetical protein CCP3SC1AL1_4110002 [Gammaproteobacteria bacterium]
MLAIMKNLGKSSRARYLSDMKTDAVTLERWIFMLLLAVLGFMCSRELNRLSQSIETLANTQNNQMTLYQDLRLELREFKMEMRAKNATP